MSERKEPEMIMEFEAFLRREEKSPATIEKYMRDIRCFFRYMNGRAITKDMVLAYKKHLTKRYAPASVNSMLVALNVFLRFAEMDACQIRLLKIQKQLFCREEKELSRAEYQRLLTAAGEGRLAHVIRTICGTGIRVSELMYITAEAVFAGRAIVNCKNKTRVIFIPVSLQKILKKYMKEVGIKSGPVFVCKSGKPLDRSNIWRDMKALCKKAHVAPEKVFPHNLRHLFARTFYTLEQDIVRLADLLGHSNINTTRIYTIETGERHLMSLERVQKRLIT